MSQKLSVRKEHNKLYMDVVMVTLGETHILGRGAGNYSITPVVTNIIPHCSMSSSDGL